jgi:high-affinity iron transporter
MLIDAVIIVLREVLEVSLLVSVMLALSYKQGVAGSRWLVAALVFGLIGATYYASQTNVVSEWFDYVGQEVVNASLQYLIYLCLACFALLTGLKQKYLQTPGENKLNLYLKGCMSLVLSLAITREGSEILIYFSSFANDKDKLIPVVMGGTIGTGIGASVGALIYYALIAINNRWQALIGLVLLSLVAAGLASQATTLLIQADWIEAGHAVWDSSKWISEKSVLGQLLYALIGYEATPQEPQVLTYLLTLTITLIPGVALIIKYGQKHT